MDKKEFEDRLQQAAFEKGSELAILILKGIGNAAKNWIKKKFQKKPADTEKSQ